MIDWQPRETVPEKEGVPILLGYLDVSGKFAARSGCYLSDIHHGRVKKAWPAWICPIDRTLVDSRFTHWSPLNVPSNDDS